MPEDNIFDLRSVYPEIEKSRQLAVEDMQRLMRAVEEAEAHSPGSKVNDIVNDLVEFTLLLTQEDCQTFSRQIRQVLDGVMDARSTHKDEYISTFSHKDSDKLTDHQKLIRSIQRDRDALEGRLGNDISNAIKNAGFTPRGVLDYELPAEEPKEEPKFVAPGILYTPETVPVSDFEQRLAALERTVLNDLTLIKDLLTKKK